MSDEVRKAAEIRSAITRMRTRRRDYHPGSDDYELDKCILAQAYLAEHPADDDEPISGQWLADIGLLLLGGRELDVSTDGYVQLWVDDGSIGCLSVPLCNVETRGDVRRLCRALGIQLKERSCG